MTEINNLLAGLDLTILDHSILKCASLLREFNPEMKLSFAHIVPESTIPNLDVPEIKALSRQQLEIIRDELKDEIESVFGKKGNYKLSIKTGSPFLQIIDEAFNQNSDLLLVGKKQDLKGSGILPQELIRFSPCNLLFVPEKTHCEISDIIVCNDFSEYSALAMEKALDLASHDPERISIISLHVIHSKNEDETPSGVISKYNRFIERFDLNDVHVSPKFINSKNPNIAPAIIHYVHQRKADMIITGSRGLSSHEGQILGSLTERLVRSPLKALLYVIKKPILDPELKEELLKELYDIN